MSPAMINFALGANDNNLSHEPLGNQGGHQDGIQEMEDDILLISKISSYC